MSLGTRWLAVGQGLNAERSELCFSSVSLACIAMSVMHGRFQTAGNVC